MDKNNEEKAPATEETASASLPNKDALQNSEIAPPKTQEIKVDDLIDDDLPIFPEKSTSVSSDLTAGEKADNTVPPPTPPPSGPVGMTDKKGIVFDERIHKKDPWGNPFMRNGLFVRIKSGRPEANPASTIHEKAKAPDANAAPTFDEPPLKPGEKNGNIPGPGREGEPVIGETSDVMFKQTAEMAVTVVTGVCSALISPAWSLKNNQEKEMLSMPLAAYFKQNNVTDLSPGWMTVAMFAMYASSRVSDEQTRTKFSKFWRWSKERIYSLVARIKSRK